MSYPQYGREEMMLEQTLAPHYARDVASEFILPLIHHAVGRFATANTGPFGERESTDPIEIGGISYKFSASLRIGAPRYENDLVIPTGRIGVTEFVEGRERGMIIQSLLKRDLLRLEDIPATDVRHVKDYHVDDTCEVDLEYYTSVDHPKFADTIIMGGNLIRFEEEQDDLILPEGIYKLPETRQDFLSDHDIALLGLAAHGFNATPDIKASLAQFRKKYL